MRPLLVLLERLWGPLGASLTALGRVLGGSSGALGDVLGLETLDFLKMSFPPRREHDFQNLSEQRNGKRVRLETTRI